ncbi:uncharacterized protein [Ptychodera flava]|uniref:uncharacterized protein n=1 Tax=Ptychodera flava TaxID=63121 RepID=UPI00396A44C6
MAIQHDRHGSRSIYRHKMTIAWFILIVLVCFTVVFYASFSSGAYSLVHERSPLKLWGEFDGGEETVPRPMAITGNLLHAGRPTAGDDRNKLKDTMNRTHLHAVEERFLKLRKSLDTEDLESGFKKERQLKALENSASFSKLETVFKNILLKQKTLRIGVSGGSISTGARVGGMNCYAAKLKNNLEEALGTKVEIFNGAVGATGSLFHTYCMGNFLNLTELDILLWECCVNDYLYNYGCSPQEEYTRKVLQVANGPQLVYVNFVTGFQFNSCQSNVDSCSKPLSAHYNVPSLDMKVALCDLIERGEAAIFASPVDHCHPSVQYHSLVGNILTRMFGNVLLRVIQRMTNTSHSQSADNQRKRMSIPSPLLNTTKLKSTQCWATVRAQTGNSNPLVPIMMSGWHGNSTGGDQARVDKKNFWESTEPNSTIKFKIDITPYEHEKAHIVMGFMTCDGCGQVTAWLDEDESTATVVKTDFRWGTSQVYILRTGVKPGVHTITLRKETAAGIRIVAIATGFN